MASMQEGVVGRSFEVYAANEPEAAMSARIAASTAGVMAGNLLYIEQIEAGKWEVVFEEVAAFAPRKRDMLDEWAAGFFRWLTTNTDTFDRVMVAMEPDRSLPDDLIYDLISTYRASK